MSTLINVTTIESTGTRSGTKIQTLAWKTSALLELFTTIDADGTIHTMTRIDKGSTHIIVVPTSFNNAHVLIPATLELASSPTLPRETALLAQPPTAAPAENGIADNADDITIHLSKHAFKALAIGGSILIVLLGIGIWVAYRSGKHRRITARPRALDMRNVPQEATTASQERRRTPSASIATGNGTGTARRAAEEGRAVRYSGRPAVRRQVVVSSPESGVIYDPTGKTSAAAREAFQTAAASKPAQAAADTVVVTETSNGATESASAAPTSTLTAAAASKPLAGSAGAGAGAGTTTAGSIVSAPATKEEKEDVVSAPVTKEEKEDVVSTPVTKEGKEIVVREVPKGIDGASDTTPAARSRMLAPCAAGSASYELAALMRALGHMAWFGCVCDNHN